LAVSPLTLILEQKQDGMALVRRRPAKPSIFAGLLFCAMAGVPAVSGVELTGVQLVTTLALALVGSSLIWLGRPSDLRTPLPAELAQRRVPGARIELGGAESYQARLVRSDGSSLLLFERGEPAGVVRDSLVLASHFGLSVRPGFLLDEVAWAALSQPAGSPRGGRGLSAPIVVECWPLQRQRTAAYTTLWAGLFVLVSSIIMAVSPYRSGIAPSFLSVLLPLLTVLYVLGVGLWLLGLRERLTFRATGIDRERLWFGRLIGAKNTVEARVLGVFPVGPELASIRHALVATDAGPLAYPVDQPVAERLAVAEHEFAHAAGRAAE
jgi:hypothetical protein